MVDSDPELSAQTNAHGADRDIRVTHAIRIAQSSRVCRPLEERTVNVTLTRIPKEQQNCRKSLHKNDLRTKNDTRKYRCTPIRSFASLILKRGNPRRDPMRPKYLQSLPIWLTQTDQNGPICIRADRPNKLKPSKEAKTIPKKGGAQIRQPQNHSGDSLAEVKSEAYVRWKSMFRPRPTHPIQYRSRSDVLKCVAF